MLGKLFQNQASAYFIKAVGLVVCLMLVSWVAPYLPSVLLPLIFIAYAIISTIGALYYTVINRLHRQKKLAETGNLSKLNRKWVVRMVGILIVAILSGFIFVLESPTWNFYEWLLIWVAIPLYFGVFLLLQQQLKKEYAPKFYKAHAMRWSFWVVGAILCVAYGIVASFLIPSDYPTLSAAFDAMPQPYEHAPSALMSEAEKLASFTDGLTNYGISQLSDSLAIIGFAFKIVAYASVFFGLVSQFGFCLLDTKEIKSEFQILPPHDEDESSGSVLPRYIIAIATVAVITYVSFLCVEFEVAKAQATEDYTAVDKFVTEQKERLIYLADGAYAEMKAQQAQEEANIREARDLLSERDEIINPLIDDYYEKCKDNVDSYLDWCEGPHGFFVRAAKPLGAFITNQARDAFLERITVGADSAAIEDVYEDYRAHIDDLAEGSRAVLTASAFEGLFGGDDGELNLWKPLDSQTSIDDILLNSEGKDREGLKADIIGLIDRAKEDTLASLKWESPIKMS